MEGAIKSAKESLPTFWKRIDSGDPAIEQATVKVAYPTASGGNEYLWMEVETHSADNVAGRLANEPEDVPGVHAGEQVVVATARVIDWAYFKGGKSYGQFTTRALVDGADEKTRRDFGADDLAPTPLEPESK